MGELAILDNQTTVQPRARMGRPTIYSETMAERICDTLARGVTRQAAYLEAGIDHDTFHAWLHTREDFSERVARAEARAEVKLTETVFQNATEEKPIGDWRPAVEWLKRRRRADYGDTLDIRKIDTAQLLEALSVAAAGNHALSPDGTEQLAIESGAEDI